MKSKKITAAVLAASMIFAFAPQSGKSSVENGITAFAAAAKSDSVHKKLYKKFLEEIRKDKNSEYYMFDLYDFDSDGIPELFVSNGDSHADGVDVYTVSNNKVVQIGAAGSSGVAAVSGKYLLSVYCGGGEIGIGVYKKSGASLKEQVVMIDSRPMAELMPVDTLFTVNNKAVSEKEFKKAYSKYNSMEWEIIGRRFKLDNSSIDNAFGYKDFSSENKILFDKRKKARKAYYSAIKEDFKNSEIYGLLYEDINGDGIEELIAAYNTYGNEILYYYTDEGLKRLELEVMSDYGFTRNIEEKNQILNKECELYIHSGYGAVSNLRLYEWDGNDYTVITELNREAGFYNDNTGKITYGQAYINGKKVSNKKFEKKLKEMNSLADKSHDFFLYTRYDEDGNENRSYNDIIKRLKYSKGMLDEWGQYIYK